MAAALACSWIWWRDCPGCNDRSAERVGAPETTPAALPSPAAELEASVPLAGEPEPVPARTKVSAVPGALEQPARIRIRVVKGEARIPAPEAELWVQREDVSREDFAWRLALQRSNDVEVVLRSGLGRAVALDERGEAFVPAPLADAAVAAASGDQRGTGLLRPDERECVVQLELVHSLVCEVVDPRGQPVAGALVALSWGETVRYDHEITWVTDEEGRVEVPALERQVTGPRGHRGPFRLLLGGGVPSEPELVTFDLDQLPREPVRFVAGASGRVAVQVTDERGRPIAALGYGWFRIEDELLPPDAPLHLREGPNGRSSLEEGRAVFERVGLGLSLRVGTTLERLEGGSRSVPGPTRDGELVQVLIPAGERPIEARGRLIGLREVFGESGEERLQLAGRSQDGELRLWDPDVPEFLCSVSGTALGSGAGPWILEVSRRGGPAVTASANPLLDAESRRLDFGDVLLPSPAVRTRIHVVDDVGQPVDRARIHVDPPTFEQTTLVADREGLYVLAAESAQPTLRVQASREGWLASSWVLVTWGDELTLTLRRPAKLAGALLAGDGESLEDISVFLAVDPTASDQRERVWLEGERSDERYLFQACEPGLGRLIVRCGEDVALERRGIELRAGETTTLDLDLRDHLQRFDLAFELASGEPWESGHLEVLGRGGEAALGRMIGASGRASFLAPPPTVDLWAVGRGAAGHLFQGVRSGERLVLPAAPTVVLRVASDVPLPSPPLALIVRAELASEEPPFGIAEEDVAPAIVNEERLVTSSQPWPGDYELHWLVLRTDNGATFPIEPGSAQTVLVEHAISWAGLDAELDPAAVALAITAAGG